MKLSLPAQPILLPSPVLIIGSFDSSGNPNIMNAAWGGIASSKPPSVTVSLREATLTYHNIINSKAFTVNIPSEKFVREADFVGMVSGSDCNKFKTTRLTPVKSGIVNAPYIEEFPYSLECKLIKRVNVGSHTMFIGEIHGIQANDDILNSEMLPDIEKVLPLIFGSFGSLGYYGIGKKIADVFKAGQAFI